MKHNSPQGPQPTGVAVFEQFPVLWARLSGEQILGLELPGEWVLGLDLSLGGPLTPSSLFLLLLFPHCCKYFNEMEKKKKDKKKRKKISSLEATGSLRPGQPGIFPEQSCAAGPWQPGLLHVCVHPPAGVGGPPEQLFTIQRQQNLEATSKQRTVSFPQHLVLSPPPTLLVRLSLASVSPPGACTSLSAPGLGLSPLPLPVARGGTLTPKDASAEMAALSL